MTALVNIIIIIADDFGLHEIGSYNTPHLDALRAVSVEFTNAHATPLCSPSRLEFLTGKSNGRIYRRWGILDPAEVTLGHALRAAGYDKRGWFGKWQCYGSSGTVEPKWEGKGHSVQSAGFNAGRWWHMSEKGSRFWDPVLETKNGGVQLHNGEFGPRRVADHLKNWVAARALASEPFAAVWSMLLPHRQGGQATTTPLNHPGTGLTDQQRYAQSIEYMDLLVGEVMAEVASAGIANDTIVIFTSDNGGHSDYGGGKGGSLNIGTHVPLFVSWPGTVIPGTCSELVSTTMDMVPTVTEMVGNPFATEDGVSYAPAVLGGAWMPRDAIYFYHGPDIPTNQSIQRWAMGSTGFKLYDNGELFDSWGDPMEVSPLDPGAGEPHRSKLHAVLDSYPAESPVFGVVP